MEIKEQEMDQLLEYEYIVKGIINRYQGYQDREDLYQVGMIGLQNAMKAYIPNDKCKFATYARFYVLGEITQYMRINNNFKISKDSIRKKREVMKTKEMLRQRLGREPTRLEVSLILEKEEKEIEEIENLPTETMSLDYEFLDSEYNLYNSIKTEDQETKPEILDLKEQLRNLDKEEQQLIYSRYFVQLTQSETSKEMGMSQAKVSRKEGQILQKLRERL